MYLLPPLPQLAMRVLPSAKRRAVRALAAYHLAVGSQFDAAFNRGSAAIQETAVALHQEVGGAAPPRTPGLEILLPLASKESSLRPPPSALRPYYSIIDGWQQYLHNRRPRESLQIDTMLHQLAGAPSSLLYSFLDPRSPIADPRSLGAGIARTLFLQHLNDGLRAGRLHVAEEDAERFRASLGDLAEGRRTPQVQDLLWNEARRARASLATAEQSLAALPDDGSRRYVAILLAWSRGTLDRIEESGFDLFGKRKYELSKVKALTLVLSTSASASGTVTTPPDK